METQITDLKKGNLNVVNRGTTLKNTESLRDIHSAAFRQLGPVVEALKKIKEEWSIRQKELESIGLKKKEAALLQKENRKLIILDKLKKQDGPFTSEEQVQAYLGNDKISVKEKSNRMRDEVTYSRDTCLTLPKSSAIFRIFKTQGKKRTMLTPEEFGNNLMILLGKNKQKHSITLEDFRAALAS